MRRNAKDSADFTKRVTRPVPYSIKVSATGCVPLAPSVPRVVRGVRLAAASAPCPTQTR